MRIITCASYYGSGSSAVTDYVSEFAPVCSLTSEEFRFLQDPDGVSDLEFHLVEHFNRHNSGHALKRYQRLVALYAGNRIMRRYERFFHGQWRTLSEQYIRELTDFSFEGWWQYDLIDGGKWYYFRKRIINKLLHVTFWRNRPEMAYSNMKGVMTLCSHPSEEKFLACTRAYIDALMTAANPEGKPFVMVDQIVPPNDTARFTRYFHDIKIVVVDRDPRDIYLLAKYRWKDGIVPTADVETYCKWFRYVREHRKTEVYDPAHVLFIRFEDMVYHYAETTARIRAFIPLSEAEHVAKKTHFDPAVSIHNTRLWEEYPAEAENIERIKAALAEYLYPFA